LKTLCLPILNNNEVVSQPVTNCMIQEGKLKLRSTT
jgi:hypothetical protein